MKYMERGGFQNQELMRWTLGATCALLAAFWVTNAALFVSRLGMTPGSIASYYLGSEGEFRAPRTAGAILEVTHMHLPMMALVMLLLTHLLLFAPYSKRAKIAMIAVAFSSALLDEGSGWLVRFVHPGFAWVKLASFLALEGTLAFLLVGLAMFLKAGAAAPEAGGVRRRRGEKQKESGPVRRG